LALERECRIGKGFVEGPRVRGRDWWLHWGKGEERRGGGKEGGRVEGMPQNLPATCWCDQNIVVVSTSRHVCQMLS